MGGKELCDSLSNSGRGGKKKALLNKSVLISNS